MAKRELDGRVICLALSAFLVIFQASETMDFGVLFPFVILVTAASVCILISQFLLFDYSGAKGHTVQVVAAGLVALLTVVELFFLVHFRGYLILSEFKFLQYMVVSTFVVIASLLPLILGSDIMRQFRDKRLKAIGLVLIAFAVFALVYFFIVGFNTVSITDAGWLAYQADRAMLVGHNPYLLNYSGLYASVANGTVNSFTLTTGGKIVGAVGYPILYLLMSMPFVWLCANVTQFSQILLVQEIIFALALFAVIAYFGEGINKKSFIAMLLIIPLLFFTLISFTDIIMIAVLLIAYFRPHKWYFGLALGIAVSIQQLAWIPAIFLLLYSIVTSKRGKAALDILVFLASVLLINSYFLLASPLAYLHDLLGQLGSVLPTALSPFGTILIRYYNMPLPYFQFLFYLALISCAIAFVCLRKRQNFAILSLVPFLFLSFSRMEYYTVFLVLGAIVIILDKKESKSDAGIMLKPSIWAFALCALAIAMIAIALYGHANYLRSFPLVVSTPSLSIVSGNSIYSALISSGNLSGYERILVYSFSKYKSGDVPVFIIGDNVLLEGNGISSTYSYNGLNGQPNNLIYINSGVQKIRIFSLNDSGSYLECAIYSDVYFYICPSAGEGSSNS